MEAPQIGPANMASKPIIAPTAIPKLQSITKNKFRFGDGKITIDLPDRKPAEHMPTLRALLEAL